MFWHPHVRRTDPRSAFLRVRDEVNSRHLVSVGLCLFVASFFLLEKLHIHRLIYYLLVLIPFLIAVDPRSLARVVRSPVWCLAVAHAAWLWLSLAWSLQPQWQDFERFGWQLIGLVSFVTIVPVMLITEPRLEVWLSRSLVAAAAAAGLFTIVMHLDELGGIRLAPIGLPSHPIIAGAAYGIAAIMAAARLTRADANVRERALFVLLLILLLAVVLLTKSRGPIVGLTVAFFLMCLLLQRNIAGILLVAGLVVVGTLAATGAVDVGGLIARADANRFELWGLYLDMIAHHPVLGVGVNANVEVVITSGEVIEHPHNIIVASQVYGGIPAALLMICLIGMALLAAYRGFKAGGSGLALWLLTFIVVTGSFDFGHVLANAGWEWLCFWLPVGFAIAVDAQTRYPTSST